MALRVGLFLSIAGITNIETGLMNTIILCGHPRSGTSIATRMLNRHPCIIMTFELMVFSSRRLDYVANRIREYSQLRIPDGNYLDRQAFIDEVLRHKTLSTRRFLKLVEKHKRPGVCWYGDKFPEYTLYLSKATRIARRPKVICCIRDPRDVMESQVRHYHKCISQNARPHHWMREKIKDCLTGTTWYSHMERWENFKTTTDLDCYEMNYGRLTRNLEGEALNAANFLDVQPEPMVQAFREMFLPRQGLWKQAHPDLNAMLPESWIEVMARHGFEITH